MASRKRSQASTKSDTVTLRLRQNAFVHGTFAAKGTEFPFTRSEAERRMRLTRIWEHA